MEQFDVGKELGYLRDPRLTLSSEKFPIVQ
jgi:hypothetical protein